MRTTSSLESMNAALRRLFPVHPHIFKFMDRLRLHEFSKSLDMLNAVRNQIPKKQLMRRKRRDKNREEKIGKLTMLLKRNEKITPQRFLEEMATDGTSLERIVDKSLLSILFLFPQSIKFNLFL